MITYHFLWQLYEEIRGTAAHKNYGFSASKIRRSDEKNDKLYKKKKKNEKSFLWEMISGIP